MAFERPEVVLEKLSTDNTTIYVEKEYTHEEVREEEKVIKAIQSKPNSKLTFIESSKTLYHIEDLPFRPNLSDLPDVFTPFKEIVEKSVAIRPMLPSPKSLDGFAKLPLHEVITPVCSYEYMPRLFDLYNSSDHEYLTKELNERDEYLTKSAISWLVGGETNGFQRIQKWCFNDDNLKNYFDIRNGMLGEKYSTKLSPYFALGCISPRYLYYQTKHYEAVRRIANKSTYWIQFELEVRDFWVFIGKKYGNKIFFPNGAKGFHGGKKWKINHDLFDRWKDGGLGIPLVDANMRELKYTGFMSNRGRQNVASYLIHDLEIDWRLGAEYFESKLIDHDVTSNTCSWNSIGGFFGGRVNKFNVIKQSKDYDSAGEYIKHWIPALQHVPPPLCFEPWLMTEEQQVIYKCKLGKDYPLPHVMPAPYHYHDNSKTTTVFTNNSQGMNNERKIMKENNSNKRRGHNRVQHL